MRLPFILFILVGLTVFSVGRGQEYTVTAGGVTTGGNGIFSEIAVGSPFTMTIEFDLSTATEMNSTEYTGSNAAAYTDATGSATLNLGGNSYSGPNPLIQVLSGYVFPPSTDGEYDYQFNGLSSDGYTFEVQLTSDNPQVAPTTSLHSITDVPISDFDGRNLFGVDAANGTGAEYGNVTSFSVSAVAAPEPSSIGFSLLALLWMTALLRCRIQRY